MGKFKKVRRNAGRSLDNKLTSVKFGECFPVLMCHHVHNLISKISVIRIASASFLFYLSPFPCPNKKGFRIQGHTTVKSLVLRL